MPEGRAGGNAEGENFYKPTQWEDKQEQHPYLLNLRSQIHAAMGTKYKA